MGYREWRERQNAKIDAMTARSDERVARAEEREAAVKAEQMARREGAAVDARSDWGHRRAVQLGEDHDDLLARAGALGIPAPAPDRQRRGRVLGALGELVVMDGAGVEGGTVDAYEAWRDRIVVEESVLAKEARGEPLSWGDRIALKAARFGSK